MSDETRPRRRTRPRPVQRAKSRHWSDFLPLISLGVFLIAVGVVAVAAMNWLSPAGRLVPVPALIGENLERAQTVADSAHVHVHIIAHRPDFHAPKDTVLGQLPEAGGKVREGRVIDVIVSDGVPMVKAPNLSNLSLRDAQLELENAHLVLGKVSESTNTDVVAGQILGQHPDPFTPIQAGSSVDVTVAKGRPLIYTPSFVGLSVDFARRAAREAKVEISDVRYLAVQPSAKPKGTVVAQDPPAGQMLAPKQRVALQVSGGAPATPTPIPTETPLPQEAGSPLESPSPSPSPSESPLLPSPMSQRIMRVSVALPKLDSPKPVRVVLQDATGSKTLYQQTTAGGIKISFDITVVGAATIETYVGDLLESTTPL